MAFMGALAFHKDILFSIFFSAVRPELKCPTYVVELHAPSDSPSLRLTEAVTNVKAKADGRYLQVGKINSCLYQHIYKPCSNNSRVLKTFEIRPYKILWEK